MWRVDVCLCLCVGMERLWDGPLLLLVLLYLLGAVTPQVNPGEEGQRRTEVREDEMRGGRRRRKRAWTSGRVSVCHSFKSSPCQDEAPESNILEEIKKRGRGKKKNKKKRKQAGEGEEALNPELCCSWHLSQRFSCVM
ncbi:hypothetical protein EYF80_023003 [Liparis tanakae]|uniref:Uncharacterized protein n=1 Tax=Liparis tanakae TaxID=230148 RepID=A0A4Z2HMJ3_9TELE|nr:hypothetical protein EYF80_023003 [Liparis tanakae]